MCKYERLANSQFKRNEQEYLDISFRYIDWECEYFFLEGLENKNYKDLFNTLHTLRNTTIKSFREQTAYNLTPKSIFNKKDTGLFSQFPKTIFDSIFQSLHNEGEQKDREEHTKQILSQAFEIRIAGKINHGRIHGFLWNNTFHIVWFDPAHNLYYGDNTPKEMKDFATVKKCFSSSEFNRLQEENTKLRKECDSLLNILEEKTKP